MQLIQKSMQLIILKIKVSILMAKGKLGVVKWHFPRYLRLIYPLQQFIYYPFLKYFCSLQQNRKPIVPKQKLFMQQSETSSVPTTYQSVCTAHNSQTQKLYSTETTLPIKENTRCQKILYLAAVYFLSVSLYYLIFSLQRSKYLSCELDCSEEFSCMCQLQNRVSWKSETYVELSWIDARTEIDWLDSIIVKNVGFDSKEGHLELQTTHELDVSCFPSQCSTSLGSTAYNIVQKDVFSIVFQTKSTFGSHNIFAIFREANSSYPQLSTNSQLVINLIFTVVAGFFTFFMQKVHLSSSFKMKDQEKSGHLIKAGDNIQIPEQIQNLNKSLQIHRKKAVHFLLPKIQENVLTYHIYDQQT